MFWKLISSNILILMLAFRFIIGNLATRKVRYGENNGIWVLTAFMILAYINLVNER